MTKPIIAVIESRIIKIAIGELIFNRRLPTPCPISDNVSLTPVGVGVGGVGAPVRAR
jgi:hypothetical protein